MQRLLLPLGLLLCSSLASAQELLRVWNWNDYIAPQVISDFEAETGIKVEYQTYSSAEQLNELLQSDTPIDVAVPSQNALPVLIRKKLLQPLQREQLPNRDNLEPRLTGKLQAYDPGNLYAIPYLWGMAGLAVNTKLAENALGGPVPNSWALLFDPATTSKLAKCGISLLDAPEETYSALIAYQQGRSLADTTSRQLQRAQPTLQDLRPKLRYIDSERYIDDLNSGKLCVALAWAGDAAAAAAAGQPVQLLIPEEGATLFIDSLVIPAKAKRADLAHRFIDYLLRPEVAASITNEVYYPNANRGSGEFIASELRQNNGIFPGPDTMRRLYMLPELPEALDSKKTQLWSELQQTP